MPLAVGGDGQHVIELAAVPGGDDIPVVAQILKKNTGRDKVVVTAPVRKGEYALLELPYAEYAEALKDIRAAL